VRLLRSRRNRMHRCNRTHLWRVLLATSLLRFRNTSTAPAGVVTLLRHRLRPSSSPVRVRAISLHHLMYSKRTRSLPLLHSSRLCRMRVFLLQPSARPSSSSRSMRARAISLQHLQRSKRARSLVNSSSSSSSRACRLRVSPIFSYIRFHLRLGSGVWTIV